MFHGGPHVSRFNIPCFFGQKTPQDAPVSFPTKWGWVKTLVPSEPQFIAGIYGCSSHLKMVSIGIDPYPNSSKALVVEDVLGHGAVVLVLVTLLEVLVVPVELVLLVALALVEVAVALVVLE